MHRQLLRKIHITLSQVPVMSNDVTLQSLGSGSSSPRVIVESSNSSSKRKSLNNGTMIKIIKQKPIFPNSAIRTSSIESLQTTMGDEALTQNRYRDRDRYNDCSTQMTFVSLYSTKISIQSCKSHFYRSRSLSV